MTGEAAIKSGAETLPGAMWVATARSEHAWVEARVRAFNNFWDGFQYGVGGDRTQGATFKIAGGARPIRLVPDMPEFVSGVQL